MHYSCSVPGRTEKLRGTKGLPSPARLRNGTSQDPGSKSMNLWTPFSPSLLEIYFLARDTGVVMQFSSLVTCGYSDELRCGSLESQCSLARHLILTFLCLFTSR